MTNLAKHCIDKEINALNNLYSVIETKEYKGIIDFLSTFTDYTKRIIIAGVGKNANIASKIAETMASLGIPTMPLNITHCGHGDYGYISKNDCIIHISRSGNTKEMLEVIDHVAESMSSVTQIMIHCNSIKKKSNCNYELWCGDVEEGDEFGLAPTSSTTTLLCILDCMAVELSHRLGFKPYDFFKFHPAGSLGGKLANKVGFIYKTTNLINGHWYIGQCSNDPREKYLGSGKLLIQAIAKYGKEHFKREILEYCYPEDLDDREIFWIKKSDALVDENSYNLQEGGKGGWSHVNSVGENNPMYGKSHSDETKQKMKSNRKKKPIKEDNPFYGKIHTDATKAKMRKPRINMNNARSSAVISPSGQEYKSITEAATKTGVSYDIIKMSLGGWIRKNDVINQQETIDFVGKIVNPIQ